MLDVQAARFCFPISVFTRYYPGGACEFVSAHPSIANLTDICVARNLVLNGINKWPASVS